MLLVTLAVVAIRIFIKRAAEQRAASDARLSAMAQTYLTAALKKKAADAAAAKAGAPNAPATPAAAVPLREERDCPFCAEPILKKARVCKHCRRDVEPIL